MDPDKLKAKAAALRERWNPGKRVRYRTNLRETLGHFRGEHTDVVEGEILADLGATVKVRFEINGNLVEVEKSKLTLEPV